MNQEMYKLFIKPSSRYFTIKSVGSNKGYVSDAVFIDLINVGLSLCASLRAADIVVEENGEITVIFDNKYSYDNLFCRDAYPKNSVAPMSVSEQLKKSGYLVKKVYIYYPRDRIIIETSQLGREKLKLASLGAKKLLKYLIFHAPLLKRYQPAYIINASRNQSVENKDLLDLLLKQMGIDRMNRLIVGKPNTVIVISDKCVARLPFDRLSRVRCRMNGITLSRLMNTKFSSLVPVFIGKGNKCGQEYYSEGRVEGSVIFGNCSKILSCTYKAAEFITKFHAETAREMVISTCVYKRLFSREFKRLSIFLNDTYKEKLDSIENSIKIRVIGKSINTVWMHGDYKIENVLFDDRKSRITGIIDWDLSRREGLPLLDLVYLLAYNQTIRFDRSVLSVYKERFLQMKFDAEERHIIKEYVMCLDIKDCLIKPLMIMFWIHNVTQRYRSTLSSESVERVGWVKNNVCEIIDSILEQIE